MKTVIRRLFRALGLHITRLPPPGSREGVLQQLLDRHRVGCVLDVGAHHGELGQPLRALGDAGHIISFEPVAASFERLAARALRDA